MRRSLPVMLADLLTASWSGGEISLRLPTDLEPYACYDVQNLCLLGLSNLLQFQELLQIGGHQSSTAECKAATLRCTPTLQPLSSQKLYWHASAAGTRHIFC